MKKNRTKAIVALAVVAIFGCMLAADRIQTGNGSIDVTEGWIKTDVGNLFYKLYTPKSATAGGQTRYKVMMNFSNLSFFDKHYTTDSDGNTLTDSSALITCFSFRQSTMNSVISATTKTS